jgi:hypothetical protein
MFIGQLVIVVVQCKVELALSLMNHTYTATTAKSSLPFEKDEWPTASLSDCNTVEVACVVCGHVVTYHDQFFSQHLECCGAFEVGCLFITNESRIGIEFDDDL